MRKYTDCFLVYLDILGFQEKVKETKDSPQSLERLIEALKINSAFTQSKEKTTNSDGKLDIRSFFFSDSFVFMMKAEKKNLPHLFLIIRYLQDRLWESGLSLRGAITNGNMYWPTQKENIIIGPAMIEAYRLESETAIYPRIIVEKKLFEFIDERNIITGSEVGDIPLSSFIKKDKDGVYFFDILHPDILRKKGEEIANRKRTFLIVWDSFAESNYDEVINHVNRLIEKGMENHDEKTKQKYEWLKSYLEESRGGR